MSPHKNTFYSVLEVWDYCLDTYYNKQQYVEGFTTFMRSKGITKHSRILDAGCVRGFLHWILWKEDSMLSLLIKAAR